MIINLTKKQLKELEYMCDLAEIATGFLNPHEVEDNHMEDQIDSARKTLEGAK